MVDASLDSVLVGAVMTFISLRSRAQRGRKVSKLPWII